MMEVGVWEDLTMRGKENISSRKNNAHFKKYTSVKECHKRTEELREINLMLFSENDLPVQKRETLIEGSVHSKTGLKDTPHMQILFEKGCRFEGKVAEFEHSLDEVLEDLVVGTSAGIGMEERCPAAGLSYCQRCERGPKCCVGLENQNLSDKQRGSKSLGSTAAACEDNGIDTFCHLEDSDGIVSLHRWKSNDDLRCRKERNVSDILHRRENSDDTSAVSYYLDQKSCQENTAVHYDFFVDDDEDAGEYRDLRYCDENGDTDNCEREDGDSDDYEGEDSENFGENLQKEYGFDDEEEYSVDDDDDDDSEEVAEICNKAVVATPLRRIHRDSFSRYQEPLEVILEILGEEGDTEDTVILDGTEHTHTDTEKNTEDDLITFSSSGEYSPDSLEEYCSRKNKCSVELSSQASTYENYLLRQDLTHDSVMQQQDYTESKSNRISSCGATTVAGVENLRTDIVQQPPVTSQRTDPSSARTNEPGLSGFRSKAEESDRDKLKSLTSEIEAYLKETKMLLESATSYTSRAALRTTKTPAEKPIDEPNKKMSRQKSKDEVDNNASNENIISTKVLDSQLRELQSVTSQSYIKSQASQPPGTTLPHSNVRDFEISSGASRPKEINNATNAHDGRPSLNAIVPKQKIIADGKMTPLVPRKLSLKEMKVVIVSPETRSVKNMAAFPTSFHPNLEHSNKPVPYFHTEVKSEEQVKSLESVKNTHSVCLSDVKDTRRDSITPEEKTQNSKQHENDKSDSGARKTSEYLPALEAPAKSTEAINCEDHPKKIKQGKETSIVCGVSQNNSCKFNSLANFRKDWCAVFKELEDSFDAVIKNDNTGVILDNHSGDIGKSHLGVIKSALPGVIKTDKKVFTKDDIPEVIKNINERIIRVDHQVITKVDYASIIKKENSVIKKDGQSRPLRDEHSGVKNTCDQSIVMNNHPGVTKDHPDVVKSSVTGVSKSIQLCSASNLDNELKESYRSVQSIGEATTEIKSRGVQSDIKNSETEVTNRSVQSIDKTTFGTSSPGDQASAKKSEIVTNSSTSEASDIVENPLRQRPLSRCESPPPTVNCLDNLEKLYIRLSLEQNQFSSLFESEGQSLTGKEQNVSSSQKDDGKVIREEDKSKFVKSILHDPDERNEVNNENKTHLMMGIQHLQKNVAKTDKQKDLTPTAIDCKQQDLPLLELACAKESMRENVHCSNTKENVRSNFVNRDVSHESSKAKYIGEKIDEIFSSVESDASVGIFSNVTGILRPTKAKSHNLTTEAQEIDEKKDISLLEKKDIQAELSSILGGLDEMYEKHLKKHPDIKAHETKNVKSCKFSFVDCNRARKLAKQENDVHDKTSPPRLIGERKNIKGTSENAAFQDIINISEDLKHLCLFHVNRPTSRRSSGRLTDTTTDNGVPEDDLPQFYDSLRSPPEATIKKSVSDKTSNILVDRTSGRPISGILQGQEMQRGNLSFRESTSSSRGEELPEEAEQPVAHFLTQLRQENLRCYEVTLMCLVKLVAMTQVDLGSNLKGSLHNSAETLTPSDSKNMSALQLVAEGRDYLMWCPDQEFDNAVAALDIRGLVELVQTLQDAMAVEQQTFDSLSQQLELVADPLQQQRLSAALCTSQTRLARLCSRNMRCFRQVTYLPSKMTRDVAVCGHPTYIASGAATQALKARQKEAPESRLSSPRDSGLVVSSDAEGDPRSPSGASFKNSLAFFQRAAHLVANNAKNTRTRHKEARRRSSRGSSCYGSSSSEAWSTTSDDHTNDLITSVSGGGGGRELGISFEDELMASFEDQGTYEQVLFINGRPQYQDDISWTGGERNSSSSNSSSGSGGGSNSWTRVRIDGSSGNSVMAAAEARTDTEPHSVAATYSSVARRSSTADSADSVVAATQTQADHVDSYVTLPRRKPYLNFKSVSSATSSHSGSDIDNEDLRYIREKVGLSRNCGVNTITRTQSFKEGLNCYSNEPSNSAYGLSRTRSFHDGLASDFNDLESVKPRLQKAPSVDEILESVKSLRAKKTMVKSTPDLVSVQEPVYHSASLPHHKNSKSKTQRASATSSLLGVRYNGSSSTPHFDRVPEPDYEQIPESTNPYYENLCRGNNHYENIHLKGEVIYDSPRPTEHHYDKVPNDLHYENVKFDAPVYENLDEKEPTYMNVNGTSGKSNVYANLEPKQSGGSLKSSKSKKNKVTIIGSSVIEGTTYDVPRAATHIYDSPQKQIRSVGSTQTSEYDTPKNNRSVLPQSTQIVLKAKSEQKQKIDDIFADCDQDSLEGDRDREPDIPSPDYGSEDDADGYEDASNDYVTSEFPDEGLGESDTRSYYTEDPGLEVILEEPEEEYCSSHASEDDLQREVDIAYSLKGERHSLDGSEGIGSAEGDTQSSGGSEHYVEEDCASSGIHSEDTPSPGPPVDSEKEDAHHLAHRHAHQQEEQQKREEEQVQQDRCVEVYPETVRQRQRNMMASSNKVDIKNWNSSGGNNNNNDSLTSPAKVKKFLPSVKALRNQFEAGKSNSRSETNGNINSNGNGTLSHRSSGSTSSLVSSSLEKTSSTNSLNSVSDSVENLLAPAFENLQQMEPEEPVEPIYNQFKKVDEELRELMSKPPSTTGWNPRPLLKRLYYIPEAPKIQSQGTTYINIEGFLEKLPSGRKKATFWNAWKRRYFVAKDGVLYYYQSTQTEKPSMKMPLMGGKVECMEPSMVGIDDGSRDSKASAVLGIDDGKGHYVVVRCSSRQEAERWRRALETHTVEDFTSQYVQPWPMPTNPALLRDTLVIDLGSASVRAGVLASQATLPQVFLPSVVATERESRRQVWGFDALAPDVRAASTVSFPIRPSHKITKYSVDLSAVSSLLQKTFAELKVDPKNYHIQLSVPRVLNTNTQTELLRVLFDKFGVRSVNLTHQSILALYAYNATSGIVVDVGERMDIVPVIDGYIVDGGVSRVPYGGYRILDHLRQFLYMRNVSLINEVESYIIRQVLENICYCAHHYNTERARCTNNPDLYEKEVTLSEYFHTNDCPYQTISLDFGRFQATEGLFNPDAWGLDHPGLHKLVHKAIMECSMDIRKEMSRSIFLAGGVTQLPGLVDRLTTEIDNLTPPAIRPKVHASPYRYHAAYIGACVLAESPAFVQSRISREDWNKQGNAVLRKWSL
ncbi:uncharacterized protein [Cherax quadricarinatus]|uniref:uncharacterized protein isoform X6 n=1 Tax=Cherax quadricarinatus TaxID=27406 RepID=UPI00387E2C90